MTQQAPNVAGSTKYEENRAVIRLVGPVTAESIVHLCDEVDLAVDYYQYSTVQIQLASPGGDVAALDYFLSRLLQWRAIPVAVVQTLALTQAASAAAVMLSLGDIGQRAAYASSELVYHDSRTVIPGNSAATRVMLDRYAKVLAETDKRMLDTLVQHIWSGCFLGQREGTRLTMPHLPEGEFAEGAVINGPDDLRNLYAKLNLRDAPISADCAKALYLIDTVLS